MGLGSITAGELIDAQLRGAALDLIDVRTPAEFQMLHARGARSRPLATLDPPSIFAERGGRNEPLYVICQTGSRARQACERLAAAGLGGAVVVDGGTAAWERAGGPVVRGRRVMSLERQVRIAAGSLVLLGSILALTVDPWMGLLPAFIGAGLVFSGVTDTCGMAMVLARMPWNQGPAETACCAAPAPAESGSKGERPTAPS
ncbi:MAG: rhodanese-like domain-containing protein [Phycisphaerales bacterium]|nr:rhodanese-like domain-containing protein [Phycisphaerales bacterium]